MPRLRASKKKNPSVQGEVNKAAEAASGILESAEVVDIILDPSHPAWNPDQYRIIGSIMARAFPREFGSTIENLGWYNPINPNFVTYPLLGEIVLLISAASKSAQINPEGTEKYYLTLVNVWQTVNQNGLPASSYDVTAPERYKSRNYRGFTGNSRGDINDMPWGETFEEKSIARLFPYEGDMTLEGRWGQSIRFGSTVSEPATKNDWSKDGQDGDPITIISNGHATTDSSYHLEDINEDASGMWMCNGQGVPIDVASKIADSYKMSYESAKSSEREKIVGATGPSDPAAGSGGSSEAKTASSPGNENKAAGDGDVAATTEVEPDADVKEAADELEVVGEYEAYRRGKFTEMIEVVAIDGRPVNKAFADKILALKQAGTGDGVTIRLNSGFRPMEKITGDGWSTTGQRDLRRTNAGIQVGGTKEGLNAAAGTYDSGFADQTRQTSYFKPLTAGPGFSNHQNGKAFDLQTGMGRDYKTGYANQPNKITKTYKWLVANAHKHGFIRAVSKERWHWEYTPGSGMFSKVPRDHPTWDGLV